MNFAGFLLRLFGWKVRVTVPEMPKSLICVAPHTSNWDFIIGELAIRSIGHESGFLMKDTWFFWPLGPVLRAMGGVAVPRRKPGNGSLTDFLVDKFRSSSRLTLAVTPEGTRSRTCTWHTGFLHIAAEADVPIQLAVIDFGTKTAMIERTFTPTGDTEADMRAVKDFYKPFRGKYPDKFCAE